MGGDQSKKMTRLLLLHQSISREQTNPISYRKTLAKSEAIMENLRTRSLRLTVFLLLVSFVNPAVAQTMLAPPIMMSPGTQETVTRFGDKGAPPALGLEGPADGASIDAQLRPLIEKSLSATSSIASEGSALETQNHGPLETSASPQVKQLGNKWVGTYGLEIQGVPLSGRSNVSAIVTRDGSNVVLRERNTPTTFDFDVSQNPRGEVDVSQEEAFEVAKAALSQLAASNGSSFIAVEKLHVRIGQIEIWVEPSTRVGRLAWLLELADSGAELEPRAFRVWISAVKDNQQLKVLEVQDLIVHEHVGRLTGSVWDPNPLSSAQVYPLPAATIIMTFSGDPTSLSVTQTGEDGVFKFKGGDGNADFLVSLENKFFRLSNGAGDSIKIVASGSAGSQIELKGLSAHEFEIAQTSAFYWVNRAREFAGSVLSPADLNSVDVIVNGGGECNASWNASLNRLTLLRASSAGSSRKCINRAYRDTVFHEFGHAVDEALGGIANSRDGRAYSEGFGDSLAILFKGESCYGLDHFGTACMRDAATVLKWPAAGAETHERGRIYSGFVWQLVGELEKSIEASGVIAESSPRADALATAKELVLISAAGQPYSIESAVELMFEADDDDLDLSNGTPNGAAITAAAVSRNIPLPNDLPAMR